VKKTQADRLALRIADVAGAIGVSMQTVKRLLKSRELASLRIGKVRLVRKKTLKAFLAAREKS
jgi:excisionase family DNA binding protein